MFTALLELPFWAGIILVTFTISGTGLVIILSAKKFLSEKITKKHEKVGRLLFRVTAGLIALLLSLSYANERIGQSKIIDSLEEEASLIVNSFIILKALNTPEADDIGESLSEYVVLTMSDEWENVDANPYFSESSNKLTDAYFSAVNLQVSKPEHEYLKHQLLTHLSEITRLMQTRFYSQAVLMPYLIYILCIGMFFMWIFFTVYNLDFISLLFISLYNIFIGILIYFVFAMSNPLVGSLKIDAHSFEILYSKGIEKVNSN